MVHALWRNILCRLNLLEVNCLLIKWSFCTLQVNRTAGHYKSVYASNCAGCYSGHCAVQFIHIIIKVIIEDIIQTNKVSMKGIMQVIVQVIMQVSMQVIKQNYYASYHAEHYSSHYAFHYKYY